MTDSSARIWQNEAGLDFEFLILDFGFLIERLERWMDEDALKSRTKRFAIRIMKLVRALPSVSEGRVIGNQLLRAGTSVGANYRAACRGRSKAEFTAKLGIVEEEADESCFWLELIIESELLKRESVEPLLAEANELVAIFTASRKTVSINAKRINVATNRKSTI